MFRPAFPLLILGVAAFGMQQEKSSDDDRDKDVYAIYSLMMTAPRTSHGPEHNLRYLIRRVTGPGYPAEPCVHPPKEREAEFEQVLEDFNRRKSTPRQLKRELSIPRPYELIDEAEAKAFEKERIVGIMSDATLDPRFTGVQDLFTLTDVYFSEKRTLALTAMDTWCGGLCALMQWRTFEKLDNGNWRELTDRSWGFCVTMAQSGSRSILPHDLQNQLPILRRRA